jgi:hypothetical protein
MRVLVGGRVGPAILTGVPLVGGMLILSAAVVSGSATGTKASAGLVVCAVLGVAVGRRALRWRNLIALLIGVIFFIPVRRYVLPGSAAIQLEPYRVLVAVIAAGWLASLVVDPRVSFRKTRLDFPMAALITAVLISVLGNTSRIGDLGVWSFVTKKLTFFLSFCLVYYIVVSLVRRAREIDFMIRVVVTCGAVVATAAIIESRTGFNVFDHLRAVFPFLKQEHLLVEANRGGRVRAYASAEHPIPLGAVLAMLVPLAICLARAKSQPRWWLAAALLSAGAMGTVSRTGMLMFVVIIIVFAILRPREAKKLWPAIPVLLVVTHLLVPGVLGTIKDQFFPKGGLVAQQERGKGTDGQGRVADLASAGQEFHQRPLIGEGYGTRITGEPGFPDNAQILDDQWLKTLLETGVLGTVAWAWLLLRFIRRAGSIARHDQTARGLYLTALTSSTAAFGLAMFTYDELSFIQVTFVFFIMIGIGVALMDVPQEEADIEFALIPRGKRAAKRKRPVLAPRPLGAGAAAVSAVRGPPWLPLPSGSDLDRG